MIIYHVHRFISETFKSICPDPRVHGELWNGYLLEDVMASYRRAMDHARFLLEIEREGSPLTLNQSFNEHLQNVQANRLVHALVKLGVEDDEIWFPAKTPINGPEDNRIVLNPSRLQDLTVTKANATQVREYMHDVLASYYEVARQRFVDVVYQQAVNHHLLFGRTSPLRLFNTEMVLSFNEEQLDMIAAEGAPVQQRREKLVRDIENFEKALKVLKGSR
jgi:hypothetical protein